MVDGKKSDAAFHADVLDAPGAGEAGLRQTRQWAREQGWSEEKIARLYGDA